MKGLFYGGFVRVWFERHAESCQRLLIENEVVGRCGVINHARCCYYPKAL